MFTNILSLLELRSVMIHALPLLYCRDTTAGETWHLAFIDSNGKNLISFNKIQFVLRLGNMPWEIIDWIYVQYMTLRLLVPVQQVITFTVAGLSSPVTRCFFSFLIACPSKWMLEICVMNSVCVYIHQNLLNSSSKCVGYLFVREYHPVLTGKNFIWWNYWRQLIFSGSNFWISF